MPIIDQIAFPILFFWFLGLMLSFFRKDLEPHWKFFFFLVFCFYLVQFFPEFIAGINRWKLDPKKEILLWLEGISKALYVFLFLLWPLVLIRIFYTSANNLSKTVIPLLAYTTIAYWALFLVWSLYSKEWSDFFQNLVPESK